MDALTKGFPIRLIPLTLSFPFHFFPFPLFLFFFQIVAESIIHSIKVFAVCWCCSSCCFIRAKRQTFFCPWVCSLFPFLSSSLSLEQLRVQFRLLFHIYLCDDAWRASFGRFIQQKLSCPSISEYEKLQAEFSDLQIRYNELLNAHQKTCKEVFFSSFSIGIFCFVFYH